MRNKYFPTTIIDGFFDYPDSIREFGLNLLQQETISQKGFPGKRSRPLHEVNMNFYLELCNRFLTIFFIDNERLSWFANAHFQIVDERYGSGWVHRDDGVATAVVYLTPNTNKSIGTSIYDKKDIMSDIILSDQIQEKEKSFIKKKNNVKARELSNSGFKEVIRVDGLYNRALLFDSNLYHAAHDFIGNDDSSGRLTLVIFFTDISVGSQYYPIPRLNHNTKIVL